MRVLHCIPSMVAGGAERQLLYLVREQRRRGLDVSVAMSHRGPLFDALEAAGPTIHVLRSNGNHDPRLLGQLVRLCRQLRPDVVQTWLTQMDVLGGVAAKLTGVPWILSERAAIESYPPTWKNRLRRILGRTADCVVSNSALGDHYWSDCLHRDRRRIIANALPTEEIRSTPPLARDQIGLDGDEKIVLYAGRIDAIKNLDNLVLALIEAAKQAPLRAYFCGAGDSSPIAAFIRQRGADSIVRVVGYVEDVWRWMKLADVFVSVSNGEGAPNAVMEAAACESPLVLSDIPAHVQLVGREGAFFADPASIQSIAREILRAARASEAEKGTKAVAALAAIGSRSVRETARCYEELYTSLARPTSSPAALGA